MNDISRCALFATIVAALMPKRRVKVTGVIAIGGGPGDCGASNAAEARRHLDVYSPEEIYHYTRGSVDLIGGAA